MKTLNKKLDWSNWNHMKILRNTGLAILALTILGILTKVKTIFILVDILVVLMILGLTAFAFYTVIQKFSTPSKRKSEINK